jgi:ArsR family transcriptional regulator
MEQSELDLMLELLENPIRRKIVERLSQEPSYSLQISKELGLGQQLVSSHLDLMEEAGLVESSMQESPTGPKRRAFLLSKSVSVTIDVGPHLFNVEMHSFDDAPKGETPAVASSFKEEIERILKHPDGKKKIGEFVKFFSDIDKKIGEFENARAALLSVRNLAMQRVSAILSQSSRTPEERRVLYHIMSEDDKTIENLSETLNIREAVIREMLKELQKGLA